MTVCGPGVFSRPFAVVTEERSPPCSPLGGHGRSRDHSTEQPGRPQLSSCLPGGGLPPIIYKSLSRTFPRIVDHRGQGKRAGTATAARAYGVGLARIELATSALSVLRSNRLSYSPSQVKSLIKHTIHQMYPLDHKTPCTPCATSHRGCLVSHPVHQGLQIYRAGGRLSCVRVRELVDFARQHGYRRDEVIEMIAGLP